MLFNIIPLVIIALSCCISVFIIVRKFPEITAIDVETLPEEQQKAVKERIIQRRIRKYIASVSSFLKMLIAPFGRFVKKISAKFYRRVLELEKVYVSPKRHGKPGMKDDAEIQIQKMLTEAKELIAEEKWSDAEKKYIEIISWDNKNYEAYQGLSDLYVQQKEYVQAKETLEYMLKLSGEQEKAYTRLAFIAKEQGDLKTAEEDYLHSLQINENSSDTFFSLGEVYEAMDEKEKAFANFSKAVDMEKNNPKYLDKIIDMCMMLKKKSEAREYLKKLKSVNPENQKIKYYAAKIKEI
ncbi:MAG: tetratricopeptide repeat protein [Parcubacteria group bacterium]|nr:tetratricopeptide repeat protein [Parcubacteria group bacterium]